MKQNNGITLLQLVITIVIMIIILVISIYYGQNIGKEAAIVSVYEEIINIENVLEEAEVLNHIYSDGNQVTIFNETILPKVVNSEYTAELGGQTGDFYFMDFTSSKALGDILGVEKVKNNYLLDYKNMNIYLIEGIELPKEGGNIVKYNSDEIVKYYNETFVK